MQHWYTSHVVIYVMQQRACEPGQMSSGGQLYQRHTFRPSPVHYRMYQMYPQMQHIAKILGNIYSDQINDHLNYILWFVFCLSKMLWLWTYASNLFEDWQPHDITTNVGLTRWELSKAHDDVIKWKHFPRYWPFVRAIHRSPVTGEFPSQMPKTRSFNFFFLICDRINDRVNNREVGDLRRHRAHYDVTVMSSLSATQTSHLGATCIQSLLWSHYLNALGHTTGYRTWVDSCEFILNMYFIYSRMHAAFSIMQSVTQLHVTPMIWIYLNLHRCPGLYQVQRTAIRSSSNFYLGQFTVYMILNTI